MNLQYSHFAKFNKHNDTISTTRPLDIPLSLAINKTFNKTTNYSLSKSQIFEMSNDETKKFLQKYFPKFDQEDIDLQDFVMNILKEYEGLWTKQQAKEVVDVFITQLSILIGNKKHVDIIKLISVTKVSGMVGLILQIFRMIKRSEEYKQPSSSIDLENIKNILQQFLQSMYKKFESQIYDMLNTEIRRMILKYKETQGLLKKINNLINQNIDVIQAQKKIKLIKQKYQGKITQLKQQSNAKQLILHKQEFTIENLKNEIERLKAENQKINQKLQYFQLSILNNYNSNNSNHSNHSNHSIHTHTSPISISNTPVKNKNIFFQQKKIKNQSFPMRNQKISQPTMQYKMDHTNLKPFHYIKPN